MKTYPLHSISLEQAKQLQFKVIDAVTRNFQGEEVLSLGDLGVVKGLNKPRCTVKVEKVFADTFDAPAALLVRGSGTGAIRWALTACLKPGDAILVHTSPIYTTTQVTIDAMGLKPIRADFNDLEQLKAVCAQHKDEIRGALVQLTRQKPEDRYDYKAVIAAIKAALPGIPSHISTDRHGRFVFSASYNQGCVSVTPLHDGLPGETITVVEGLEGCHSANISPDNRTLWVPALKQDRICLFTLSDDGFLSAQEPAEVTTVEGAGPRHMVFHPNQQYGYCVNELNSSIDVWELKDPKGNIECVQTLDMMPPDFSGVRWAADIHITPDGRHLYACDRTASIITVFSVSEDGSVLAVEGYQPTETQPRGFNLDHSGKYLIAAGQKSHHIAVYDIVGEQGLLQEKGRYAVGQGPMWVVVNAH